MRWSWREAMVLYTTMLVFVVTCYGLAKGYRVKGGVVQGGGMDPIFFVWFSLLLAAWCDKHTAGGPLWTAKGVQRQGPGATVDDTVILAQSLKAVERDGCGILNQGTWMNLVINASKFQLLHWVPIGEDLAVPVIGTNIIR